MPIRTRILACYELNYLKKAKLVEELAWLRESMRLRIRKQNLKR